MRASRLINILTSLQARGRATASELAEENEVDVRTIYRDIDALSASGVPVYSERAATAAIACSMAIASVERLSPARRRRCFWPACRAGGRSRAGCAH